MLIHNQNIKLLLEKYQTVWALNHFAALAGWDMSTKMPQDGAACRGLAKAKLASLRQRLILEPEFKDLVKRCSEDELNPYESAIIRVLSKNIDRLEKLPAEFVEEFQQIVSASGVAWEQAKIKNDFSIFAPHLEKVIKASKQKGEYIGYDKHPYDAHLDDYEEGWQTHEVQEYFDSIRPFLSELLEYVRRSDKYIENHPLATLPYDKNRMEALNIKVLEIMQYEKDKMRIDVSAHPFSSDLDTCNDVRITTWYHDVDLARSFLATAHEYGHALYELQVDPLQNYTPIKGGVSSGVHESQSRFWENMVARTKTFLAMIESDIHGLSPEIAKFDIDEIYKYVNLVRPSLIRVEADEITYHFHIMIRYELEKAIIEGDISVKDLPALWDEKYEKYLGMKSPTYSDGILQDIHWSQGYFGYFPTYSSGTTMSAFWGHHLEKDLGNIEELIKAPEGVSKAKDWLKEKVHKYGSTYIMEDLLKKSTGEDFNTQHLKDYLEKKYKSIY